MERLALHGGTPVRDGTKRWPKWPQYDEHELRNVQEVFERRDLGRHGARTHEDRGAGAVRRLSRRPIRHRPHQLHRPVSKSG